MLARVEKGLCPFAPPHSMSLASSQGSNEIQECLGIWKLRSLPSSLRLELRNALVDGMPWATLAAERPEVGVLSLRKIKGHNLPTKVLFLLWRMPEVSLFTEDMRLAWIHYPLLGSGYQLLAYLLSSSDLDSFIRIPQYQDTLGTY